MGCAGTSRGGEAVGHASSFNSISQVQFDPDMPPIPLDGSQGLGPYQFNLRGVVAIARVTGETGDVLWRQLSTASDMPPAR